MVTKPISAKPLTRGRVAFAKAKTEKVQGDIQRAEAELHLANRVIADQLANGASEVDLGQVVVHTEAMEEKLRDATEDLQVVTELLQSEEQDRMRLEQSLAERKAADSQAQPGTRSGEGSDSVIEHLRELTRHKLNADTGEPVSQEAAGAKAASAGKASAPPSAH